VGQLVLRESHVKTRFLLAAGAVVMFAGAAQAQAPAAAEDVRPRFGIGISLAPAAVISSDLGTYVPIGLGNLFFPVLVGSYKIEAEAGVLHFNDQTSGTGYSTTSKSTSLRLGVGAFKVKSLGGGTTLMYIGPRVGLISTSTSTSYSPGGTEQSDKETDWVFGMAVGGEHFLSRHFSLGGEMQLNYISFGQPDHTPTTGSSSTSDRSAVTTNGLLFVRVYF
jgi:hypothetical protein